MMSAQVEVLWGVAEVARRLGMSKDWVYRRVAERKLPHVKLGNKTRFRPEDVERWLAAQVNNKKGEG